MYRPAFRWLESKPFERQILILALVLDPIGFAAGYLLAPSFDVTPLMGGVYGLIAASMPMSLWIMHYQRTHA
ncbi:hypothetical protein [Natrarchaeobius chitinivorans]|uniref:DUF8141 domain-containing protein n=1 Tax=Natrarchaeobius chitinivorans TaxID=1679083 RepID=A0A3N6P2J7_NATCH|nr:hypothetical protein [Natrarchaeobius chitinivorans]RQG91819.1 hypothetical protein EA473_18665 [Natrarchaeobius chitinivorans]